MRSVRALLAGLAAALLVTGAAVTGTASAATACTTSLASGGCGPYYGDPAVYQDVNGSPDVAQDVWNQVPGWQQALTASSLSDWSVSASMPRGNTAVVSYPSSRVTYTLPTGATPPLANFGDLRSSWSHASPASISGDDFEWAYDIWLNPAGQPSWGNDQEVMIWTDVHGQRPAGNDTGRAYTDAAGTSWETWLDKGGCSTCTADNDHIVTYVRHGNAAIGTVDLSGFFAHLMASGYTTGNAGIDQVNYGVELCSTNGTAQSFAVTGYTLTRDAAPAPTPPPTPTIPAPTPTATAPAPAPTGLSQAAHVMVTFSWSPVAGATGYEIRLRNSAGAITAWQVTAPGAVLEVRGGSRYAWQARASGGAWSPWRSFTSP